MDVSTLDALGALVGAAAASFGASWVAIGRPIKKQLAESSEPFAKAELLTHRVAAVETVITKLTERVEHYEARASRTVTDEEFATYTNHTTKAVQNLTEKVGHVTGALEAWYRQPPK